jgi:myo-inositol-1-phosphate synthase
VPWLTDRKWAHIRLEGEAFGDVPLTLEAKLEVWDSPNSAGIVIDAVRCCKLALNHGLGGPITGASAYLMKSPPEQHPDPVARDMVEDFIAQYGGAPKLPGQTPKPAETKSETETTIDT